jgi:hypothetical protein
VRGLQECSDRCRVLCRAVDCLDSGEEGILGRRAGIAEGLIGIDRVVAGLAKRLLGAGLREAKRDLVIGGRVAGLSQHRLEGAAKIVELQIFGISDQICRCSQLLDTSRQRRWKR